MTSPAIPPGWPRDLPAPGIPEFDGQVTAWLLDRLPPEYRATALRQYPLALAMVCVRHAEGDVQACREAYRNARAGLRDQSRAEVDATLAALEAVGAQLQRTVREAQLVEQALRGIRWTAKL